TARLLRADTTLTQTGSFLGSPAYMSPEALNGEALDARSDIWSFGVLLFEMLAGRRPFGGEYMVPLVVSILNQPTPQVREIRPDLPPALDELLQQLLVKDRGQRMASIRQVAAALEAIRAGLPVADLQPSGAPLPAAPSAEKKVVSTPLPAQPPAPLHNLPHQPTLFIGREAEMADIRQLLLDEPACRLLTLVGPGGIGKTRLALALAEAVLDAFLHGVFFVPLAPLSSAGQILPTLAESLDFQFYEAGEPKQQLLRYLEPKQMLLVMDNFEHVLAGSELVMEILQAAPGVKVLVTSRERLHLSGETLYALRGLDYPGEATPAGLPTLGEAVGKYDAPRLFLQHARLVQPNLQLEAEDFRHLVRICRLVQGMPLALVLAAGWLELLSFQEIADEIAQCLDFLESQLRDIPERQRSMRAVFDYSWKRLPAREQQIFARLAVFRGGFTRQAAERVAGATLPALRVLVSKSFLSLSQDNHDTVADRYEIHELLRQFGEQALEASGEAETARTAHSHYYLATLFELEAGVKGRRQLEALNEIETDMENIRSAWNWALDHQRAASIDQALESLHLYFDMRGRQAEGTAFLRLAYERLAATPGEAAELTRSRALARSCFLQLISSGDPHGTIEGELQHCLETARRHNHQGEVALCLGALGSYYAAVMHNFVPGLELTRQAHDRYRAVGDDFFIARSLGWLATTYHQAGDVDNFHNFGRQTLEAVRQLGSKVEVVYTLANVAEVAIAEGDYEVARSYLKEAVVTAMEMALRMPLAYCKMLFSFLDFLRGDLERAGEVAGEAYRLATEFNHSVTVAFAQGVLGLLAGVAGDYSSAQQHGAESLGAPLNHGLGLILANWALALASCGRQEESQAMSYVRAALDVAQKASLPSAATWLLPVAAVSLAGQGDGEQAVALLALVHRHPLSPTSWMERWPLLNAWRAELEGGLGAAAYQAAWERGRALELEVVVNSLQ
ncbi:MAG: protein kinase, partial [Chloroflexi bacterium]|nr:protein kinase [Chloroflexota bacterium]